MYKQQHVKASLFLNVSDNFFYFTSNWFPYMETNKNILTCRKENKYVCMSVDELIICLSHFLDQRFDIFFKRFQ